MIGNQAAPTAPHGRAYLVGAGPGDAELITVRGLRLLQRADVVIYDRLIAPALLDEIRPEAQRIFVGKQPHYHVSTQAEINQLLVAQVRAGHQVVRLKGGDPFVFGRGGEEALALQAAGLPFEIVPGVSSALAAPAYAGIPVTQRGVATNFAVVTGHACTDSSGTDWDALARIPTLVILMGVSQFANIAKQLMAAGRAPATPAAAIQWGSTPQQQVVCATLATLAAAIQAAAIESPATIVVGEVVALREQLAWFQPEAALPAQPPFHWPLLERAIHDG